MSTVDTIAARSEEAGFPYKTQPFDHQHEEFLKTRDRVAHGRLWEQGTGKTKTTVDEVSWLFLQDRIEAFLIVAPNGVHRNWIVEELPLHMPDRVLHCSVMHWYSGERHNTAEHRKALDRLNRTQRGQLAVLAISYDSLMTSHGRAAVWEFIKAHKGRVFGVLDESRRVKSPDAKRTIRALAMAKYLDYRRILNGTPVANSPFDLYSQIKFLDDTFWDRHGISSYAGFKATFANFKPITLASGKSITVVNEYKNLQLLNQWLDEICTRVTKDDVLDLPPKLFKRLSFDLTPAQRRVYDELEKDFVAFLDNGDVVSAPMALTRMLRLQQVASGYVPTDIEEKMVDICPQNPRLELLEQVCEDCPHGMIIYARFRRSIDKIMDMLGPERAVRYDGAVSEEDRAIAIHRFQKAQDAQFFVGNPQACGEGLTLHRAKTVYYYENSFNLAERLQSEDRAHRIGQDSPVQYIDSVASQTIDEHIARCLVNKLDIACQITGDNLRSWFR